MILPHLKLVRLATAVLVAAVSGFATNIALAAPPAVTSDDVIADPAAAWRGFLAQADINRAYPAYQSLTDVGYTLDAVDTELCRSQGDSLRKAIAEVPVSIAIQRASMLCAQATGDDAAAEHALATLAALSKHALVQASEGLLPDPIRVFHPLDAYALIRTSGLEFRYEYFSSTAHVRFLPLVIAAWDEDAKVERHLTFDYLDAAYATSRTDKLYGYPVQRQVLRNSFIKGMVEREDVTGLDFKAVMEAAALPNAKAKVERLRPAAQLGGIDAIEAWIQVCATEQYPQCADGLIDALLPAAEKQNAWPMALLAFAYDTGIGLAQDASAADKLLDAADRRWIHNGASIGYAKLWTSTHKQPIPERVAARLAQARTDGNAYADFFVLLSTLRGPKPLLSESDLAYLAQPRNNGQGKGYAILAGYYQDLGKTTDANEWTRRAALAGDPTAQAGYAFQLLESDPVKNATEAKRLLGEAAHGGDPRGARGRAWFHSREEQWVEAELWLYAAADAGHIDPMLDIAAIYEGGHDGVGGTREQAIKLYRSLSDQNDVAEARRRLAAMAIEGRGMPKDPQQAGKWLLQDAEKGDHASEVQLGIAYLRGQLGQVDETQGRMWMDRAMKAQSEDAYSAFGYWLFYTVNTPQSQAEAISVWEQGFQLGQLSSTNNLAWVLCTVEDGPLFDARRGMTAAAKMAADPALPPAHVDTVAACHAASGDFASAIAAQLKGIEGLPISAAETRKDFDERLALYRAGKRYILKRED